MLKVKNQKHTEEEKQAKWGRISRAEFEKTLEQWVKNVKQTRKYGSCYIHSLLPLNLEIELNGALVHFNFCSFGRSWQGGGHKSKAYAYYTLTGRPVPSKMLANIEFCELANNA